jgi:hypothetical protein
LTHKGELLPSGSVVILAKLSARNAGSFALDSWKAVVEVLEPDKDSQKQRHLVRHRYEQAPQAGYDASVTVIDKSKA